MSTDSLRVHICFGSTDKHVAELERCALNRANREIWWTIHKSANPGDFVAFYMISPRSSFVASGVVAKEPHLKTSGSFAGSYFAQMDGIKMLPRPVHLHEAQSQFPGWAYLRIPRRSATVPPNFAQPFLDLLNGIRIKSHTIGFAEEEDIEGLRTESLQLRSTRSKRLRDMAIVSSHGICAVCSTDFSKVLGGRGFRVLQVHHKYQLSNRKCPAVTKLSDLVVVCANCHLLLHLDSEQALNVSELRRMLRRDFRSRAVNL